MLYKIIWVLRAYCYRLFFKKVGSQSYLGKPLFLRGVNRISLGHKVRIFPNSRMEVHTQNGSISIRDNCSIGQNFHIISADELIIGENTLISFDVMVTNVEHDYRQIEIPVVDQPLLIDRTFIDSGCFIGSGVKIQAGTILGKNCVVGANAVIRGHFPDYCVIVGVPGKIIKKYNLVSKVWEKTNSKGEFLSEL